MWLVRHTFIEKLSGWRLIAPGSIMRKTLSEKLTGHHKQKKGNESTLPETGR